MSKQDYASQTPPQTPTRPEGTNMSPVESDGFKNAVKHIINLASCSEVQIVAAVTKEMIHQQDQIKEREGELVKLRNTVDGMFDAMEKEKAKIRTVGAERDSLQKAIADKDKGLQKNAQQIKGLQGQLESTRADRSREAANAAKASKDISELQEKMKEREMTFDKLRQKESSTEALLSAEKKKNAELENAGAAARADLERVRNRLQKLESFRVSPTAASEDSMMDDFSDLWDYAKAQMWEIIGQDLNSAVLQDKSRWEKFRKAGERAAWHWIPILASNTPAAKGMRLVVLLAILSREIDKSIFQPNYLLSEGAQLRDIFSRLAETDGARESICRSTFLSIDPAAQQESLASRVQSVVRQVSFHFSDFLTEDCYNSLRQNIENVVKKAIAVWHPINRAEARYEPDFDPLDWGDHEWSPFQFPGQEASPSTIDPLDSITTGNLLTVFPRISRISDGDRQPLTFAIQIRKSHPLFISAEQEIAKRTTVPSIGHRLSISTRRRSITANTPSSHGKLF
ncbi:hypothetical protein BJY04DRAFT_222542 [Aspergillus karnatakaensis]|uniref:uncharacterized protein n=1 Tax=Aspergillus karnatakaensis TaxID=1810916 RepID=UPI003CCDF9F0